MQHVELNMQECYSSRCAKNHLQQGTSASWQNHSSRKKPMSTISHFPQTTFCCSYPITSPWTQSKAHYWQQAFQTALYAFHNGKALYLIDRLERIFSSLKSEINKRKGPNVCLWLGKWYMGEENLCDLEVTQFIQCSVWYITGIPLKLKVWRQQNYWLLPITNTM